MYPGKTIKLVNDWKCYSPDGISNEINAKVLVWRITTSYSRNIGYVDF